LRPGISLRPWQDRAIAFGSHPSACYPMHPSHAFVLSLCTGGLSVTEIALLFAETYGVRHEEADATVGRILARSVSFVDLRDDRVDDAPVSAQEPRRFLFPSQATDSDDLPAPVGVNVSLTFRCNFRCEYCYQVKSDVGGPGRLDLGTCLNLLDQAAAMQAVYFGLTGGEPTLFDGWESLVAGVLERDMIPVFTSNGMAIGGDAAVARRLAGHGLKAITISLDASNADLHHTITKTTATFDKVTRAIGALVDAGVRVSVKNVLTPANAHDIGAFLDLVAGLGVVEVGITAMEGGAIGAAANSMTRIDPRTHETVRRTIREKSIQYPGCRISPPKDRDGTWDETGWFPCGGLAMGMSIMPSGDVTICDKLPDVAEFTYGNVYEQSLDEIWKGPRFAALRERARDQTVIDPECADCTKVNQCRTSCFVDSFNATGNYYAKHPNCSGPYSELEVAL
jgi:radical SAM protein with 4Fe4S-binding SPASM domain